MDVSNIAKQLAERGYPASLTDRLAAVLPAHDARYAEALAAFLAHGDTPCLESHGVTTRRLMRQMGFTYPNAVNVVIWIEDEPEEALAALNEGYDTVDD